MRGTVLITGGAGFIGSHATLACLDAGYRAIVYDDLSTGVRSNVPPNADFVFGTTADPAHLLRVLKAYSVEAILQFAASVVVSASVAEPTHYIRNNLVNSLNVVEAALAAGVTRLVFSSTAAVYAPTGGGLLAETSATRPLTPYGRSKLMTEELLADVSRVHDFRHVVLRYFNVAGADPAGRSGQSGLGATHLIKAACQVALGLRAVLPLYGIDYETCDGTCVRDYIHVTDLATAHVLALEYLEQGGASGLWNCGYGRGVSVREVIRAVERVSGRSLPVQTLARRAGDSPFVVAEGRRIRAELGWSPRHADLYEMVAGALAWERRLNRADRRPSATAGSPALLHELGAA